MERENREESWKSLARPGYLGKLKDEMFTLWDSDPPRGYRKGNWRIVNETSNKEIYTYEDIIYRVYVPGYEDYFLNHQDEAVFIANNFSYGYDKDKISKLQAFDIYELYNKEGVANQFHHVAFNLAITNLGLSFKGKTPVQVREGKPGTPNNQQPNGFLWSPGRIPCTISCLIPEPHISGWWNNDSIEDFYQSTKVLQIKV